MGSRIKEKEIHLNPNVTTPEARENELINLAYDAVAERIKSGNATSAELVHFLKLGSTKERLSKENLISDMELKHAKIKALEDGERLDALYQQAIDAMKSYAGVTDDGGY